MIRVSIAGLNIQFPWSQLLLSGEKTIETRKYTLPSKHILQPLAMIETPGKEGEFTARIVGVIVFSESFRYFSKAQFDRAHKDHLVPSNHDFYGWNSETAKWGWRVCACLPLKRSVRAPSPRGIVFATGIELPAHSLSEEILELLSVAQRTLDLSP